MPSVIQVSPDTLNSILADSGRMLKENGRLKLALENIIAVCGAVPIDEGSVSLLIEKLSQCREIAIAAIKDRPIFDELNEIVLELYELGLGAQLDEQSSWVVLGDIEEFMNGLEEEE